MYGARNLRPSRKAKSDHFSHLLSTMDQTNILNLYTDPTPVWQDTHEVSKGLEHVDLDPYAYVSARLFLVYLSNHTPNSKTKHIVRAMPMQVIPIFLGFDHCHPFQDKYSHDLSITGLSLP